MYTTFYMNFVHIIISLQVMKKDESVYLESGRRPLLSESSRLLDNVTKRFHKNKQRQEQQASLELDAR